MNDEDRADILALTIEVISAYVSNNSVRPEDMPLFIARTHEAITGISTGIDATEAPVEASAEYTPAVTARKSLASHEHIVSMIDGKPYRSLKRHLSANGLTPADYRERYGLKPDYPMVAPGYSEARRAVAVRLGLGRKPKEAEAAPAPAAEPAKPAGKPRAKTLTGAEALAKVRSGDTPAAD